MTVYTADDREPGEFPTDPQASPGAFEDQRFANVVGATPSLAALQSMWAERDANYATRAKYLTDDQIEAARLFRMREAHALNGTERAKGEAEVEAWYPPEHGQ
jgi:hypothetical protein